MCSGREGQEQDRGFHRGSPGGRRRAWSLRAGRLILRRAEVSGIKPEKVKADAVPPALNSFRTGPDETGHFGIFGGRFVAETLMPLILDLEKHYNAAKTDRAFKAELDNLLAQYAGRPSPLYYAERMTFYVRQKAAASGRPGGAKIYFKREELNHTGAHKINNVLGQILLARRMGKSRII